MWQIDLPNGQLAAKALAQHHRARHSLYPSDREFANRAIAEEIDRMYAPRDAFGKRAHPIVKGVTDRNAPKR
jgi:hypothetical protein